MTAINEEQFQHIASLAKLSFSEEEVKEANAKFEEILKMVEQMNEVDTEDEEVMRLGINLKNVMRDDEKSHVVERDLLFQNAKTTKDGFIRVPATFDESGE